MHALTIRSMRMAPGRHHRHASGSSPPVAQNLGPPLGTR